MNPIFDVLVVGAGVVGCSVARELSRYRLSIGVLEKGPDVCMETSSRNSAVLHAGYNNKTGSLMAKFCVEGNRTFDQVAKELDIPYRRTGKLVVGFTDEDREKLEGLKEQGERNGIEGIKIVERDFIDRKAPYVGGNFAMWSPTTAILSPFQFTFGMAENAASNGVRFFFDSEVTGIAHGHFHGASFVPDVPAQTGEQNSESSSGRAPAPLPDREHGHGAHPSCESMSSLAAHEPDGEGMSPSAAYDPDGGYLVETKGGQFFCRWVINCAGLGSDKISSMLGIDEYTLYPCRGEYFILDKNLSHMLPLPAYPVPNIKTGGLGIHLTPTLDGNIMVGPSTEYIDSREDYSATQAVMDMLIEDGGRIFPYLKKESFIRNFAGIRPKLAPPGVGGFHDFVIERRDSLAPHAVNLVGIESPGLTSAVPIAHEVIRLMKEVEPLTENPDFNPIRKRIVTFRDKSPEEQARLIAENPDYGDIICRCETITKAEVLAAIRGPLGAKTVTGVKYRCRAMMGRCQGGYCQPKITELLMEEKGIRPEELTYERRGSYLFTGEVREK